MSNFVRVEERPLYYEALDREGGIGFIPTQKALINVATGEPISTVGINYQVVDNETVFGQLEDAIRLSNLDTNGMERNISTSHNGGRTVLSYTFPEHRIAIKKGDEVDLTITALNSYDTSWRFRVLGGAFRILCANGLIDGDTFLEYSGKHTISLDTERAIRNLETSLDGFLANAELWKAYPKIKVTPLQVNSVFEKLAQGSKSMLKGLDTNFEMYKDEVGQNLWALFNTLTEWSTHAKIKNEGNAPSIIINREEKVRKLLPMLEDIRLAA